MSKYFKALLMLALIMFVTTFAAKHNVPVHLDYYLKIFKFECPLYAVIYIAFVIGALIGMVVGVTQRIALWNKMRTIRKELKKLKKEVSALQPAPAKESNVPEGRKKDVPEQEQAQLPAQRPDK